MSFALRLWGQTGSAEILGTVRDGAGSEVVAVNDATGATTKTAADSSGNFHLLGLPAGEYTVRSGQSSRIVELHTNDRAVLEFAAVEVTEQMPLVNTLSGASQFGLGKDSISTLPLDGRNFIPLLTLSPGVALPGGGSLLARINGSRPRTNEYLYDGISALQPEPGQVVFYPIIDAIEEFHLNLNSYSPEYGRSNGGTVMVVMKSGSNELHGALFEYFRNEALNARNFFAPAGPKPDYRRNQYGAALGGPIRKNKTFLFGDWQGTRLRTGITRISTVPTAAQRAGQFTGAVYDPATNPRTTFAGGVIPQSRWDAVGAAVLQRYPTPTTTGAANNYSRTAVEPDAQDQGDVRIDHYLNDAHRLFGRYSLFHDDDTPVTPLPDGSGSITTGVTSHTITRGDQAIAGYDWSLSPGALNQARFGYTRRSSNGTGPDGGGLKVPGLPQNSFSDALPVFLVAGYQQIGAPSGANSRFTTSVTEYTDTFSWVRGAHTLKFGANIRREALDVLQPPNPTGSYTINTTGTNATGVTGSGNAVASLLLGQVNAFSIDIQQKTLQERAHIAEFFAGDDWRISDRVTLNVGARYTLNFPSTEKNGQGAVFNLATQVLDFPKTARALEWGNIGPRLGLAVRPGAGFVVRWGYGIVFFEQSGITTPFTLPQFPFVQTVGQQSQDNIAAAFALAQGPTVQVTAPNPNSGLGQGVFGADRNAKSGYSQQWNFTVGKELGKDLSAEVAYVGSKATHLGLPEWNLNQLPTQYLSMGAALLTRVTNPYYGQLPASSSLNTPTIPQQQLLRAYPRFTSVVLFRDNEADSNYHALQARLTKRLARGLTATAAYTYSKLIDDASTYFSQTIFTGPVLTTTGAADAFNRKLERDLSTGDIPHVFTASFVYELPRLWKVRGVTLAGTVRLQAGDTVAISQATNNNSSLGFALQRPNRVADPNANAPHQPGQWFNTAAFTTAPQFTIGTSSRDPIRGPGLYNADLMLAKTFALSERLHLEMRAEAFNVSNTPPLNDPNASFGSAAFGTITSAGTPRDFEFAMRVKF
jgi:hypothetical protein